MKNEKILREISARMLQTNEMNLSKFACHSNDAFRKIEEKDFDVRFPFAVDRDRIVYSGAYRRYQGKTQVFSFANMIDEEMSNRSIHTTYVSQISRTIGKMLSLNLELIEAIALGHDLGHTPFGHDGEKALSKCCEKHEIGRFYHNIESMHIVDNISRQGRGLNLTFQVRDGIISHDGEVHNQILKPNLHKTEKDIDSYIAEKMEGKNPGWMPFTMEGCVVRISDTIAYIGQDIEDAIRYDILKREELPKDCVEIFGDRNSTIIDRLVKSVVIESFEKDYIGFDNETSDSLLKLKKFNYEKIYTNKKVKQANSVIYRSMDLLFDKYLDDIKNCNSESKIFKHFLNHKNENYLNQFNDAEKVRDFIATMTDRYFNEEAKNLLLPGRYF